MIFGKVISFIAEEKPPESLSIFPGRDSESEEESSEPYVDLYATDWAREKLVKTLDRKSVV